MSPEAEALGYFLLIAAYSKLLAAFEENQVIAVKPRMYFFDVVQVDDGRPWPGFVRVSYTTSAPRSVKSSRNTERWQRLSSSQ